MDDNSNWLPGADRLLRFLTSMPRTSNTAEWTDQFKKLLQDLLGEVDRVSIMINALAGLNGDEQQWLRFFAQERPAHADISDTINAFSPGAYFTLLPNQIPRYQLEGTHDLGICPHFPLRLTIG
jgi:hypothetical protein